MKRTLLILLLIIPAALFAASATQKYPPYPDVWGYELPGAMPNLYKKPDGEIVVAYSKRVWNADGDIKLSFAALEFFSGKKWDLHGGELNALSDQYEKYKLSSAITFSDGSVIKQESEGHVKCFVAFAFALVKRDKAGKLIANKTLVHIPDKPRTFEIGPEMCRDGEGKDSFKETVETIYSYLVPLEDETFLVYDRSLNFVLRVDKDLNLYYKPYGRFFLIDRDIIKKLTARKAEADKVQAVYKHVTALKER